MKASQKDGIAENLKERDGVYERMEKWSCENDGSEEKDTFYNVFSKFEKHVLKWKEAKGSATLTP
jgi:hypothetical protein